MTDIHQWRRMIHPGRSKTPPFPAGLTLVSARDRQNEVTSNPDVPPTSHRRRSRPSRPRISTYLNNYLSAATASNKSEVSILDNVTTSGASNFIARPDPNRIVECLFAKILTQPFTGLSVQDNSSVLHVIEAYRNLSEEVLRVRKQLEVEVGKHGALQEATQAAEGKWRAEEEQYKAEIRRLGLLLEKTNGTTKGARTRQDSAVKLRKDSTVPSLQEQEQGETVYEFLVRSRRDEQLMRKSQRVPFRLRPPSPSQKMATLSHKMSTMSSQDDLVFGTPPVMKFSMSLNQASSLPERQTNELHTDKGSSSYLRDEANTNTSISADSQSCFTSSDDLLPDEVEDNSVTLTAAKDEDFLAARHVATILARRRGLKVEDVLPQLVDMIFAEPNHSAQAIGARSSNVSDENASNQGQSSRPKNQTMSQSHVTHGTQTDESASTTGSDNLQSHPDPKVDKKPRGHRRPFSFYAGDDRGLDIVHGMRTSSVPTSPVLKRNAFLLNVNIHEPGIKECPASPYAMTSNSSDTLSSVGKASKIPSPVHDAFFARPRRDTSSSSLLSNPQGSPGSLSRTISEASSRNTAVTIIHKNSRKNSQSTSNRSSLNGQTALGGRRLTEQKNSLRNNAAAVAAARACDGGIRRSLRSGGRSSVQTKRSSSGSREVVEEEADATRVENRGNDENKEPYRNLEGNRIRRSEESHITRRVV